MNTTGSTGQLSHFTLYLQRLGASNGDWHVLFAIALPVLQASAAVVVNGGTVSVQWSLQVSLATYAVVDVQVYQTSVPLHWTPVPKWDSLPPYMVWTTPPPNDNPSPQSAALLCTYTAL